MGKQILIVLFLVSAIVMALPAAAGSTDIPDQAEKSVCSELKAEGVTKGLFGLCVAYCEAEASSERVLDSYNRVATKDDPQIKDDPPMPCLESAVSCPCWDSDKLAYVSGLEAPLFCQLEPAGIDEAVYGSGMNVVVSAGFFDGSATFCGLSYPDGLAIGMAFEMTTEKEDAVCRAGVRALALETEVGEDGEEMSVFPDPCF